MAAEVESRLLAIALFRLKGEHSVQDYRRLSAEVIRPGMAKMPSVLRFCDYSVQPVTMSGDTTQWQLCEVIEITSVEEFHRDNTESPGGEIAELWNSWVESSTVLFANNLNRDGVVGA